VIHPDSSAAASLGRALDVLFPVMDILAGRVEDPTPPPWLDRRGWEGFLRDLSDEEVIRCETEGLGAVVAGKPGAPAGLRELATSAGEAARLPALQIAHREVAGESARSVKPRKQAQLAALLGAVEAMAGGSARIVDVGAGSGHFTRLAAEMFERETLGLERDEGRLRAAASRGGERVRYVACDACREPLLLAAGDLAVGLHACGDVGDRLVSAAADVGCDLALVSCCFQKIGGPARAPLSARGAGFSLAKETLGLANLTAQPEGVETSTAVAVQARQTRHALFALLRGRGVPVAPGEEMRGINRRRAHAGLAEVARRALELRGLPPPTAAEIAHHEALSEAHFAIVRRLSAPRNLLARLVEVSIVLDRAARMEEAGLAVRVATAFDRAVTPRNVARLASREPGRLPPVA
jgi:SAM-dependent methyltransferase